MKIILQLTIALSILLISFNGFAQNKYITLKQPDGTTFEVVERGLHQWHFYETRDGFIIRKGKDGYYYYNDIDTKGKFLNKNIKVGKELPLNVQRKPYDNPAVKKALTKQLDDFNSDADGNRAKYLTRQRNFLGKNSEKSRVSSNLDKATASPFTINVGILLVEFSDVQHHKGGSRPNGYTVADFENMYNSYSGTSPDGETVFGSVKDYFKSQSHGILTVTGTVINGSSGGIPKWINLGNSSNYYHIYSNYQSLLYDATDAAVDSSWNISYDVIAVVIAGDEYSNIGFATGFATFQTSYTKSLFDPSFDYDNFLGAYYVKEREDLEWHNTIYSTFTHIGLHSHELFHVLGWGVPYVLGTGSSIWAHPLSTGHPEWTLMSTGYRTGPVKKSESPMDLDPIARIKMEWATPTVVTSSKINETISYLQINNNPSANFDYYQINDPSSSSYFIIENRQYSGWNAYGPGWWKGGTKGGLLIWQASGQQRFIRPADNDLTDYENAGIPYFNSGDLGDPFPGEENNTSFNVTSTPSSDIGGNHTFAAVTNISSSATNMTANLYSYFIPGPTNLTWTDMGYPRLSWTAATGADSYTIRRIDDNGTFYFTGITSTFYNDQTVETGEDLNTYGYSVKAVYNFGSSDYTDEIVVGGKDVPKGAEADILPTDFGLTDNFPNPFNPVTEIEYQLPKATHVTLMIYNIKGQEVARLVEASQAAGYYSVKWDASKFASGVYIYRITAGSFTDAKRMVLIK